MNRIIGKINGKQQGPLVLLIGGLHGNEQESLQALDRVFQRIAEEAMTVTGTIVAIRGNQPALKAGERFINYDLNRSFTVSHLEYLRSKKAHLRSAEDYEALEMTRLIDDFSQLENPIKILVDLHTTSAARGNFVIVPEYFASHPLTEALKLPVIINLESFLKGTLSMHACDRGFLGLAFEGGQIGSQEAVDLHEAGIWILLHESGAVKGLTPTFLDQYRATLGQHSRDLPQKVKVNSMHMVHEGSEFCMKPGYFNFKPISRGEPLARDKNGEIAAPHDGMIFMPLYQKQGNDGFFIIEELHVG
jgi:succinylglutamate desuccinylase